MGIPKPTTAGLRLAVAGTRAISIMIVAIRRRGPLNSPGRVGERAHRIARLRHVEMTAVGAYVGNALKTCLVRAVNAFVLQIAPDAVAETMDVAVAAASVLPMSPAPRAFVWDRVEGVVMWPPKVNV